MPFVVDSLDALERLRTDPNLRRTITRITVLAAPGDARHPLESALNRHYFACGCAHGALAVYLGLAAGGTMWVMGWGFDAWRWWKLALIALVCSLAGKFVGMAVSRWRLQALCAVLAQEFMAQASGADAKATDQARGARTTPDTLKIAATRLPDRNCMEAVERT